MPSTPSKCSPTHDLNQRGPKSVTDLHNMEARLVAKPLPFTAQGQALNYGPLAEDQITLLLNNILKCLEV